MDENHQYPPEAEELKKFLVESMPHTDVEGPFHYRLLENLTGAKIALRVTKKNRPNIVTGLTQQYFNEDADRAYLKMELIQALNRVSYANQSQYILVRQNEIDGPHFFPGRVRSY